MNKSRKILALGLAAAMMAALAGCGDTTGASSSAEADPVGIAVQVETVEKSSISAESKVSGKETADNESSIFVATSAKCTAVYVQAGDAVTAGQQICTLDLASTLASQAAAQISYDAAVTSYQNQKTILEKQVALAVKNAGDTKALFEIGAASQTEVDQAEIAALNAKASRDSALSQLEAGMQNAKSGVEQLNAALENVDAGGNVIAPMDGTLVTLNATEGGFVSNAMPVAVVDGVDQMKIVVSVAETLVPKLSIGDSADVVVSSIGKTFTATIRAVEQSASQQTKLYAVTLSVPADVSGLLSGMFADVTFHTDTAENTIVVPAETILTSGETQYVCVVEDGVAHHITVTTGLTGNGVTEITSGLSEGAQLVTVGQSYLDEGDAVRIVTGEA